MRKERWQLEPRSGFHVQNLTDAAYGFALHLGESQEFETVMQSVAVAHDGANLQWTSAQGQREFEGHDLAEFEVRGESGADSVSAQFRGSSPAGAKLAGLQHFRLDAHIDGEPRITAGFDARLARRILVLPTMLFCGSCHGAIRSANAG